MSAPVGPLIDRIRDRDEIPSEKILEIARRKGEFRVSWRYRDERLHHRCVKLCKRGLLRSKQGRGETIFEPTGGAL